MKMFGARASWRLLLAAWLQLLLLLVLWTENHHAIAVVATSLSPALPKAIEDAPPHHRVFYASTSFENSFGFKAE